MSLSPRILGLTLLAGSALLSSLQGQPGRPAGTPWEWRTEISGAGASDIAEGTRRLGEIRHANFSGELTRRLPLDAGSSLLLGGVWRQLDLSGSSADVPDRLQAFALRLGYERRLSPQWTFGADASPGFYSDFEDLDSSDFNTPLALRLMSASSRDFQWGVALLVDPWRPSPVIGGPGVRWQFSPGWTLIGFPPEPRVEYAVSKALTVFAGGGLRGGTFRVAEDFGRRRGRPLLDGQRVDFREIGLSAGARWQIAPGFSAQGSVGWMLDRRFEYDSRNLLLNGDGAVSFTLALRGSF
jgi:hypothetical protein